MTRDDRHQAVEAARTRSGLSVQQLWLRHLALGGTSDAFVDGYLQGLVPLDPFQQGVLAQAVNEELEDVHRSLRVPLSPPAPAGSLLDAVVQELLAAGPDAPGPGAAPPAAQDRPSPPRSPPGAG